MDHHVRVVTVDGVGQRDQEAEQLSHAWQAVGDQGVTCCTISPYINKYKFTQKQILNLLVKKKYIIILFTGKNKDQRTYNFLIFLQIILSTGKVQRTRSIFCCLTFTAKN